MKRYTVIIESGPGNLSAYVPDLPGCIAVGDTREEIEQNMQEAIEFHIKGLREDGLPIPEPNSASITVEVVAA